MADPGSSHAGHDLEDVAALADDPADATAAARVQVADCPDCAALLADLRLLATATVAVSAPSRPRDFRLGPDDVRRLAAFAPEPAAPSSRLALDMTMPAPDHLAHDPVLIAAHLDGTVDARDHERVNDWLDRCASCASLRADLATIAIATRELPTPPRPRDFALSEADAERVRGRRWRRALATFASPGDRFSRPLAVGLTTLGLAGLVLANIPSVAMFGSGGAAMAAPGASSAPQVETTERDTVLGAVPQPAPSPLADGAASPDRNAYGAAQVPPSAATGATIKGTGASGATDSGLEGALAQPLGSAEPDGPSALVIASLTCLLTGFALALLRWGARRLGDG